MWGILIESFYSYIFLLILYKCGTGFFIVFLFCFLWNEPPHLRIIIYSPIKMTGTSLVAQLLKNPPLMQETWVRSLGWEDPLEKGKATHSSILAWRIPWSTVHGVTNSWTWLRDFHFQDDYYQKTENNKSWWGFVEIATLCTIDGNIKWYSYCGK